MRKVYPIMFLLALIFSLIAFAGVSLGQSNVQYVTCPSNNTDNPNQVVLPFSPVDVTFNQDIEYAPPADLTGVSDVIYMTADNFGDLTGNLDVQPLDTPTDVLWLLDPSTGSDSPLPAKDTIHVHIPASWITDSNGNQILDQDIDFTFYTGDYESHDTSTTYSQDHYLFNFVTPLQTPPSGSTAALTVVKTVYGRSDVPVSDFTLHVSNSGGEVGSQEAIAGGNAFTGLPADTYTVSETNDGNAPSGYTTTFGGFDDNTSGTTALAAGVAETVYVTNTYPQPSPPTGPTTATLTVVKEVYGGVSLPSAFSLHVLSGGSDVTDVNNPNFKSPQPGSETGTSYTLDPGTYTVSEDVSGSVYGSVYGNVYGSYTPSFSGFDSSDSVSGTVYLVAGGARTVTVINQHTGSGGPSSPTTATLTVVKHVYSGTAAASDFTLYVKNSDGTVVEQGPGSETGTSYTLDPGTYTVSEAVYNSVYGNVYGSYTPSFSGFDSSDSVSGTVYLVAGGARTVTVINQYTGNPSGSNPSGGNPSGGNPTLTPGKYPTPPPGPPNAVPPPGPPNAAPPTGPPNAAPPPGPPKLPKTGVDPGGASVPWPLPAGILSIALLSFVVVQRKRIFSAR
jgi:hypothetical protein